MRVAILIVVGLMYFLQVNAQDNPTHRLRLPTAREYLQTISQLPELLPDQRETLELELGTRYANEIDLQDYELLDETYRTLYAGAYVPKDIEIFWLQARVSAWLTAHQFDLDKLAEVRFQDVPIPITAFDLNSDGENEWLLDFRQNSLQGYVFVQRNADGKYRTVITPLPFEPYEERPFAQDGATKARWDVQHLGDLNDDGRPEIVVLFTYRHDDYSNTGLTGRYYILSWQNNSLVDVGAESLSFELQNLQTSWRWEQSEQDAAWQLRQIREMQDNWGCHWERTTTYHWDGSTFAEYNVEAYFPKTGGCLMRLAEEAMWANDYDRAIRLYQQMAQKDTEDDTFAPGDYPYIRWATALALNGEVERGIELLGSRQADPERRRSLPELITALLEAYKENPTPFGLCLAAYDFHWFNPYYVWFEQTLEVGHTIDNIVYPHGMYSPPPASPEGAGCDAPALVDSLLSRHTFTTDTTPADQLAALGISWTSVHQDDLNGDGVDEWLIAVVGRPLLFVSEGSSYHVSRERIGTPTEADEMNLMKTIHLPDNAGTALFSMSYAQPFIRFPLGYGIGSGPGECPASGRASVWWFTGHSLEPILSTLLCEELKVDEVVDNLQVVSQVRGWEFSDQVSDYVPVQYIWNAASQAFELSMDSQARVTPSSSELPKTPAYEVFLRSGKQLFVQGHYDRITEYHMQAVAEVSNESAPVLQYWRYLAALTYETLNRPDEALAEYIAIYEAAPDSAWGMLAALHLEPVAP